MRFGHSFAIYLSLLQVSWAFVHPITTHGRYFIDTITKEPFYIKGVDYQPGGSSGVSKNKDPLSDPEECARDILLFQDLGINTIRIYSINSELNHDVCMSLLATAGIYLVLDVNSPLPDHHLNRVQPWESYNENYLENVFKVVEQFSTYNNTLGFFAGNEVVNDKISAKNSPIYVKALIRDIKMYIEYNSPRPIPVGYSAADDLQYRISFSDYLECVDTNAADSVDFYGVNSYQWCGEQTFYSSGYNVLVDDYSTYSKPVFFSEFGCNEVSPRAFDEVQALYSTDMIDVFTGGLVYEFSQEPNNYGLVEIAENGDVRLLKDYMALKSQFEVLPEVDYSHVAQAMRKNAKQIQTKLKTQKHALPECETSYSNLDISKGVPESVAEDLIHSGVNVERGKYVPLDESALTNSYNILATNGEPYNINPSIERVIDIMSGREISRSHHLKGFHNCTYNDLEDSDEDVSGYSSYTTDDSDNDEVSSNSVHQLFNKASTYLRHLYKAVSDRLSEK